AVRAHPRIEESVPRAIGSLLPRQPPGSEKRAPADRHTFLHTVRSSPDQSDPNPLACAHGWNDRVFLGPVHSGAWVVEASPVCAGCAELKRPGGPKRLLLRANERTRSSHPRGVVARPS